MVARMKKLLPTISKDESHKDQQHPNNNASKDFNSIETNHAIDIVKQ